MTTTAAPATDLERVAHAITALGDQPDTIAQHLRTLGITGQRAFAESCPIANYLRRTVLTDATDLLVDIDNVSWRPVDDESDWQLLDLKAEHGAVVDFIARFDLKDGPYTDLAEPEV